MASRSTLIKIQNNTNATLTRTSASLSAGEWTENMYPPDTISANGTATFQAESDGFATGDQGSVNYQVGSAGQLQINFDDPFSGSNGYSVSAPSGYSASYTGGDGNNGAIVVTLTPA